MSEIGTGRLQYRSELHARQARETRQVVVEARAEDRRAGRAAARTNAASLRRINEGFREELSGLVAADRTPATALSYATPNIMAPYGTSQFTPSRYGTPGRMLLLGDAAHAVSPPGRARRWPSRMRRARPVHDHLGHGDAARTERDLEHLCMWPR
jgi:2-polyprenyl-6-methoxyphenol hydroxylase-like FAD-dependent oxidoreductase